MHEDGEALALADPEHGYEGRLVDAEPLDLGMELYSLHPQGDYLVGIRLHIALGIQGTETADAVETLCLGGYETVDAGYLMGRGGYGMNEEMICPGRLSHLHEMVGDSGAEGDGAVEFIRAGHCLRGDLFGVNVGMHVGHFESVIDHIRTCFLFLSTKMAPQQGLEPWT